MLEITDDMETVREGKVVVYFTAEWCQPCKQLKPQYARAGTLDKKNKYYVVDVDKISDVWLEMYNIKSIPQVYIFNHGVIMHKVESKTTNEILEEVNNVLV